MFENKKIWFLSRELAQEYVDDKRLTEKELKKKLKQKMTSAHQQHNENHDQSKKAVDLALVELMASGSTKARKQLVEEKLSEVQKASQKLQTTKETTELAELKVQIASVKSKADTIQQLLDDASQGALISVDLEDLGIQTGLLPPAATK